MRAVPATWTPHNHAKELKSQSLTRYNHAKYGALIALQNTQREPSYYLDLFTYSPIIC